MKLILDYISDPVINNSTEIIDFSGKRLRENYREFTKLHNKEAIQSKKIQLKSIPKKKLPGQIWLCKQNYVDYLGNDVQGTLPYYILIVRAAEVFVDTDTEFIRVQPISTFTEFHGFDDIVVDDASILGFPFLIETWNEQPILTSLVEVYITDINIDSRKGFATENKNLSFTGDQKIFRNLEVNNTSYLRQSVISVLSWLENKQEEKSGVLINFFGKTYYPPKNAPDPSNNEHPVDFKVAAKKGFSDSREIYRFQEKTNDHTITIIKDENRYNVILDQLGKSKLIDGKGTQIQGIMKNKKQLFNGLNSGIYELINNSYSTTIKIRLQ